jgi:hypothetical protein
VPKATGVIPPDNIKFAYVSQYDGINYCDTVATMDDADGGSVKQGHVSLRKEKEIDFSSLFGVNLLAHRLC